MSKQIGALIREFRQAAGLSQENLAVYLDLSYQQVQKYEYGSSKITVDRLIQIADILRVPMSTFLPEGNWHFTTQETEAMVAFRKLRTSALRDNVIDIINTIAKAGK